MIAKRSTSEGLEGDDECSTSCSVMQKQEFMRSRKKEGRKVAGCHRADRATRKAATPPHTHVICDDLHVGEFNITILAHPADDLSLYHHTVPAESFS